MDQIYLMILQQWMIYTWIFFSNLALANILILQLDRSIWQYKGVQYLEFKLEIIENIRSIWYTTYTL